MLIVPPNKIVRPDGTLVKLEKASTPHVEVVNMWNALKDWRMLALLPMFFASNYFYAYQGAVNAFYFDGPTRESFDSASILLVLILKSYLGAVNAVLEGSGAIIGALLIGFFVLDGSRFKRRTRGFLGLAAVTTVTIAVWSAGLVFQTTFTRSSPKPFMNYKDPHYHAKGALYFFYYFVRKLDSWIFTSSNSHFRYIRVTLNTRLLLTGLWEPSLTIPSLWHVTSVFTRLCRVLAPLEVLGWTQSQLHS
jgi:hypothetical protein